MIADAMDHHSADPLRDIRKAILDREDNTVVQRIAPGRAVEAHGHDRARFLDLQQRGWVRSRGGSGVSHWVYYVLSRIVIFYNYWRERQGKRSTGSVLLRLRGRTARASKGGCSAGRDHRVRRRPSRLARARTRYTVPTTPDARRSRRGRDILRRRR